MVFRPVWDQYFLVQSGNGWEIVENRDSGSGTGEKKGQISGCCYLKAKCTLINDRNR